MQPFRAVTGDGATLVLREALSDADLEAWRQVRTAVLPDERALSVAEMRAQVDREPGRLLLLAEVDGEVVGSGLAGTSSFGVAGLHPRVVAGERRRGIGTALHTALVGHARARGFREAVGIVGDPGSLVFAERHGYREVDRQIEQVRELVERPAPPDARTDVDLVTVAERPELLGAAYPLAEQAYAEMATFRPVTVTLAEWLAEEATLPGGSFVALADGEIVGFSGLCRDVDEPTRAEGGLTVVRRDWRRRRLATTLKQAELSWAAANGVRLISTWTQPGNEAMRAVNERLGFVERHAVVTVLAEIG